VRVWIWYVTIRHFALASVRFGGGDSGGAGASDSWGESTSGSSWIPSVDLDVDLGDDGWLVLVLLVVLVLVIALSGGYLIWIAPQILPEAAFQAVLASTLARVSKQPHHDWMPGVLRATAIPFVLILLLSAALGWAAHRHCPQATRLADVFHCPPHHETAQGVPAASAPRKPASPAPEQ
jgi:hypothetical protein